MLLVEFLESKQRHQQCVCLCVRVCARACACVCLIDEDSNKSTFRHEMKSNTFLKLHRGAVCENSNVQVIVSFSRTEIPPGSSDIVLLILASGLHLAASCCVESHPEYSSEHGLSVKPGSSYPNL